MGGELRELALFAGAGGGILGGVLLGWRTVCAVEIDDHCRRVLMQRQDDGMLHPFPIWDDVCTFDGKPWRGKVDVISGGFPCQDISAAGKGAGIEGSRSGLWSHMARIVGEVRPRFVFVENSPLLVRRGLAVVLGDLASMGYDARWCVLGADDCGAPHRRKRIWILAHANGPRLEERQSLCGDAGEELAAAVRDGAGWWAADPAEVGASRWGLESRLGRVADGVADRVVRLKAIGNGQVPIVAATAWRILGGPINLKET